MNEETAVGAKPSRQSFFILHSAFFIWIVATVPPNFTPRLAATGNAANRPSALSNARSLAASTFTTLAEILARLVNEK